MIRFSSWVVEQMVINLAKKKIPIGGTELLILGFSFKENCNDCRNTKVFDIVENVRSYNMDPIIVDPVVDKKDTLNEYGISILDKIPENKKIQRDNNCGCLNSIYFIKKSEWLNIRDKKNVIIDIKYLAQRY